MYVADKIYDRSNWLILCLLECVWDTKWLLVTGIFCMMPWYIIQTESDRTAFYTPLICKLIRYFQFLINWNLYLLYCSYTYMQLFNIMKSQWVSWSLQAGMSLSFKWRRLPSSIYHKGNHVHWALVNGNKCYDLQPGGSESNKLSS